MNEYRQEQSEVRRTEQSGAMVMNDSRLFYVGCLPRSGSAWLSSALNACTPLTVGHEVLGRYGKDWTKMYDGGVGSDIIVPRLMEYVPSCTRLFYLHRYCEHIQDSLKKTGTYDESAWEIQSEWADSYIQESVLAQEPYPYKGVLLEYEGWTDDATGLVEAVYTVASYMDVPVNETKLDEMLLMRVTSKRWNDSIKEEWSE